MRAVDRLIQETLKSCNVNANELKKGDKVEDINKDCKEYKAKGKVKKINKIKDGKRVAGNIVEIEVENKGKKFKPGQTIRKTEIQLRKLK